jgi:YbbR domain-containing protein
MSWLLGNWHLKLAAIGLATVLYTGFVYSGSFTEQPFPGLAIEAINQPDGVYPLTQSLGTVDVQYRLSSSARERVTDESFAVTVDLAAYDMEQAPQLQSLPVRVAALQEGLEVLSFTPDTVPIALDRLATRSVRVEVRTGDIPDGLAIGRPRTSHQQVVASGPQSQLGRVDRAIATVQIFESGIDVRQPQADLVPVDIDGRQVQSVELDPATIAVEIDVRAVETSKTVQVRPRLTGSPADGFEVGAVTVEPSVVTIFGLPDVLQGVTEISTEPLPIAGAAQNLTLEAALVLPEGARLASDATPPVISITIEQTLATRNFLVGVTCEGTAEGFACLPQQSQLAVTLSGPATALAGLDPADLTPILDAAGLDPGQHQLTASFSLPDGVELVSVSPGTVTVTIVAPATPSPSPS